MQQHTEPEPKADSLLPFAASKSLISGCLERQGLVITCWMLQK
jgi:hypothetical protein